MTASAIYAGTIRHRRFAERERSFQHGVAMAYIDLGELPDLLGGRLVSRRPGLARFRRSDYFAAAGDSDAAAPAADSGAAASAADAGAADLAAAVRARVAAETGEAPNGAIRVLTHLRSFGHCFNPVSFYYCFDGDERLAALVAEVTNTPWGERQSYVLTRGDLRGGVLQGESEKLMHVSPFFGMDQRYEWRVAEPGETLALHIENHERGRKAFDATLSLARRELSRTSLAATTLRYPFATLRILALIYAHAAAIRLSGVRTRPHPAVGR